ncbi:MAG: hypothetical protein SNJ67_12560 [Chloracidobacterium sp.]|uniref:HTH gntR-type domain-containing protein n=1 Tax=Chloracidobacterium validum TaxID=2821543 RepID=A0ABX8B622_9BACT|nr:hypothetical protein [Chloracidobacterium validum]QUW02427.1 hypothetical protein J8C06_08695 [Chloracidobacterium validum]
MPKLKSRQIAQARLRGDIFSALRSEGFLPISKHSATADLLQTRFGTTPDAFWKAVHELERERCVRVTPQGIYFVPPEERW